MRVMLLVCCTAMLAGCSGLTAGGTGEKQAEEVASTILRMEQAALDQWCQGDPSGYIQILAPDIVYIDPDQSKKVSGLPAVTAVLERARGKVKIDRYELINPTIQVYRDTAILTYNYTGYVGGTAHNWNCTQVYCKRRGKWWIVHTHWSITGPLRLA